MSFLLFGIVLPSSTWEYCSIKGTNFLVNCSYCAPVDPWLALRVVILLLSTHSGQWGNTDFVRPVRRVPPPEPSKNSNLTLSESENAPPP